MAISRLAGLEIKFRQESPFPERAYLVVDCISYVPSYTEETTLRFIAYIYDTEAKKKLLTSYEFYVERKIEYRKIKAKLTFLPPTAEVDDIYLVENSYLPHIKVPWLLAKRKIPEKDGTPTDGWGFWLIPDYECFSFNNKFCKIDDQAGSIIELTKPTPWKWRHVEKGYLDKIGGDMCKNDDKIIKQCYNYLKTLPGFSTTLDC